jgi:hypothetical protein
MTNIDELTKRVQDLVAEIDNAAAVAKAKHRYTIEHDDGDPAVGSDGDEIDASDPSMDATDDAENGDDDEEDGEELEKATINAAQLRNDRAQRPGALPTSTHFQSRHKFEALTSKIVSEEGIPKSQAMALARQRYPEVYANYVGSSAGKYFKRGSATFEDLVGEQMAKGCNYEIAAQRVMQLHGSNALRHRSAISKRAADIADTFDAVAEDIWGNSALDRCEALREARKARPHLFKALQDC